MNNSELINSVLHEMSRVWGEKGLGGSNEEYEWLLNTYNVSEEEDVQWQLIIQHDMNDLPIEDQEDKELMTFLNDKAAVNIFLKEHLSKYKSSKETYISPA
jgi:hypothetical protein